jgi:hypothetical protein
LSKNWSPGDLCRAKHLLKEARAIEEARIAKNVADSWCPAYKPGWRFSEDWVHEVHYWAWQRESLRTLRPPMPVEVTLQQVADALGKTESAVIRALDECPRLNPYRLALDEFETPDDRWVYNPWPGAKDYRDASEGPGRVTVCGSNYDVEEVEAFSPYDAAITCENNDGDLDFRSATADEEDTLGFDTGSDLIEVMTDAVKAWAGMTGAPPKAADPAVEVLIQRYLANGGQIHTRRAYQTTPKSKIRFKLGSHPAWAGGTGIPPELRKLFFGVRPKTGSKQWSNTA